MKKILSVVMAAAMVAVLAIGCGNKGKTEETTTAAETTADASKTTETSKGTEKASESATTAKATTGSNNAVVDTLGEVKAKEAYEIGFSMPVRDQFMSAMEAAAVAEGESQGIKMTVVDANNNANTQMQNVQTFVSSGCKAIIVGLVNTDNAQQIIDAASGIPVVFVNRRPSIEMTAGVSAYVGSDERNAGRFEGEFLADFFKKQNKTEINTVMLQGVLGLESVISRTESAYEALEAAGLKVNKAMEDTAEWDRAKAQNKVQTFLGTGKAFDCVIANNDEMALGAIEALKSAGVDLKAIPVVGIDATPAGLTAMEAGELAFTVFQNPVGQGAGAVRAAVLFANGETVPANIDIPFEPVTQDNYKNYMS